jgi:hypothetical protein
MVIGEDRGVQVRSLGEISIVGAEVVRGRLRGVVHIVRVRPPVTSAVAAQNRPGTGQELHRADRVVPPSVAVPAALVGVVDRCHARRTVKSRTDDPPDRRAIGREFSEPRVVRLDPANACQQLPAEPASGFGVRQHVGSPSVRVQDHRRDRPRSRDRHRPGGNSDRRRRSWRSHDCSRGRSRGRWCGRRWDCVVRVPHGEVLDRSAAIDTEERVHRRPW